MKLLKFRATGFRSVTDSEWIEASDVTALIGENEAGKTNLLLPLWKLNPSSGGEINILDDMPRGRYAEMRARPASHRFIYCIFELDEQERALAERFGAKPNNCERITVRRNYAGQYGIDFTDDPGFSIIEAYEQKEVDASEEDQ
ncbi:MAG: OLD family endonuclease, partial [Pseudomonadota bacterium]